MRRPLAGVLLAVLGGLVLRRYLDGADLAGWLALAAAVAVLWTLRSASEWRFVCWLVLFGALGWLRGGLPPSRPLPENREALLVGRATSGWSCHQDACRLQLELEGYSHDLEHWLAGGHRVLLSAHRGGDGKNCPPILPGERVRVKAHLKDMAAFCNPGLADRALSWRRQGVLWRAGVGDCQRLMVEAGAGSSPAAWIERARQGLEAFFRRQNLPAQAGPLLASLTTGRRDGLSPELQDNFRKSGLAHLLAISGLHLMLVAAGLYWLLVRLLARLAAVRSFGDARPAAALISFLLAVGYTLLSGAGVPVVRALVMAGCGLMAVVLGRQRDWVQVLCAAALIVLVLWPQSLWTAGFQLSFSAVLGLILAAPFFYRLLGVEKEKNGLKNFVVWTGRLFSVSLAAWLFTLPVLVAHFGQIALWGPVVNLVAVPLAAWLVVPLGLTAVVLVPISESAAGAAAWLAGWPALALEKTAQLAASLPESAVLTPLAEGWLALIFSAGLALVFFDGRRIKAGGAVLMLLAGLVQAGLWLGPRFSSRLEVTFLDVGQGDSALVRMPGGGTLLIDGGPASPEGFDAGRLIGKFLQDKGFLRLDAVMASHPEADHIGGLVYLVENFRPRKLYTGQPLTGHYWGELLLEKARESGTEIIALKAGDEVALDAGAKMEVFWPTEEAPGLSANERSLVVKISFGNSRFLFLGDLEGEGERRLLESTSDLGAEVVKVAHHGSAGASSEELVERVRPALAVVSAGRDNLHRFPHRRALERWAKSGARLLRTDVHGAVTVSTDGRDLAVETVLSPAVQ
jgi:competence protein ComEC